MPHHVDNVYEFCSPNGPFLNSPREARKTEIINTIRNDLEVSPRKVKSAIFSTVAARILKKIKRLTLRSNVLCHMCTEDTCYISVNSKVAQKLSDVSLISMVENVIYHRLCIEYLNNTIKNSMCNKLLFDGKVWFFAGHLRQILSVVSSCSSS